MNRSQLFKTAVSKFLERHWEDKIILRTGKYSWKGDYDAGWVTAMTVNGSSNIYTTGILTKSGSQNEYMTIKVGCWKATYAGLAH